MRFKKSESGYKWLYIIFMSATFGLSSTAHATFDINKTRIVNCNTPWGLKLNKAIALAKDGDIIKIFGDCVANIKIKKGITLDGGGEATLSPEDSTKPTITIIERNVVIEGVNITGESQTTHFFIGNQATVLIKNNTISNSSTGISVVGQSLVSIVGNHILDIRGSAISVQESSNVRVGYYSIGEPIQFLPNILENAGSGIVLVRSKGEIIGNHIINNFNGVVLLADSSSRIAGNELAGNNQGVLVLEDSHVDLALNGDSLFSEPNYGSNAGLALVCVSSYVGGVIGPDFAPVISLENCENNTIP